MALATSSAEEESGAVASPSNDEFNGLAMSTTTLPASFVPSCLASSIFVPYQTASTTTSPSSASPRLVLETFEPFWAEAFTSVAVFSAVSGFVSTKVTECPPATKRVPIPFPIFPAPIIVTFILTLLMSYDIIQSLPKQQMLSNLLLLPFEVNHQTSESVG